MPQAIRRTETNDQKCPSAEAIITAHLALPLCYSSHGLLIAIRLAALLPPPENQKLKKPFLASFPAFLACFPPFLTALEICKEVQHH